MCRKLVNPKKAGLRVKSLFATYMPRFHSFLKSSFNYWMMFAVCNAISCWPAATRVISGFSSCPPLSIGELWGFRARHWVVVMAYWWTMRRSTWHRALRAPHELYYSVVQKYGNQGKCSSRHIWKRRAKKFEQQSIFNIFNQFFFCFGCYTKLLGHFFFWFREFPKLNRSWWKARSSPCSRSVCSLHDRPRPSDHLVCHLSFIYSSLQ